MTLLESLYKICKENIDETNDWYNWRKINESLIPDSITLPKGNQYTKNIYLKKELNSKWENEIDLIKQGIYIEYYIKTWGGIKGNKKDSMIEYQTKSADELIKKGVKGIASWSKALVLHNYNKYAIFDARVSCSLNCLQIIDSVDDKILFPILASQNKTIISANKKLKSISKIEKWEISNETTFYNQYLNILKTTSEKLNTNISTVEMLLFAKAEELINKSYL